MTTSKRFSPLHTENKVNCMCSLSALPLLNFFSPHRIIFPFISTGSDYFHLSTPSQIPSSEFSLPIITSLARSHLSYKCQENFSRIIHTLHIVHILEITMLAHILKL